ncbi:acyl-CoA thioesterase [Thermophagus sp. OGC60D27]|uniref:acyl-CoA thioesterase n=1 Tax=Thermophagus sp. OGC60D27 TaxID=3458415 RepID=UPI004037D754
MHQINELYKGAETRQCKMVFPGTLNANETLFGGEIMKWMDETAFICATRATRQKMFTASVEKVEFKAPVKENSIVEIIANVKNAGPVKLEVEVELYAESLYDDEKALAAKALFVMIALNDRDKVTRLSFHHLTSSYKKKS